MKISKKTIILLIILLLIPMIVAYANPGNGNNGNGNGQGYVDIIKTGLFTPVESATSPEDYILDVNEEILMVKDTYYTIGILLDASEAKNNTKFNFKFTDNMLVDSINLYFYDENNKAILYDEVDIENPNNYHLKFKFLNEEYPSDFYILTYDVKPTETGEFPTNIEIHKDNPIDLNFNPTLIDFLPGVD
ncbi:hypothetical protein GOQ27_16120 [Clostridium sp. D2Q-11]|uniref:Uncharacterized protein n=1 Tax=Anaeromonas frigoriresistens TaxID=2683708 RepID=A0A942V069_9FIRM|nr:hypothetical protein [Anaeromonas frigoriresistens]MBS4540004.1 hypothetical protein [Anaeromonas frigoriresistens]